MDNLKAITQNTDEWLPKCSRTSTFNVITDDGCPYEVHNNNESFFEGSQFEHPNKSTAQLFDNIREFIEDSPSDSMEQDSWRYNALTDLHILKQRIESEYMRINTIHPNSAA